MISHLNENLKRYYNEAVLKGKQEGKREGVKEGELKTARRMLTRGVAVEIIADYTGLSLEEVEQLKLESEQQ